MGSSKTNLRETKEGHWHDEPTKLARQQTADRSTLCCILRGYLAIPSGHCHVNCSAPCFTTKFASPLINPYYCFELSLWTTVGFWVKQDYADMDQELAERRMNTIKNTVAVAVRCKNESGLFHTSVVQRVWISIRQKLSQYSPCI